jgi:mercuric ion transport protein
MTVPHTIALSRTRSGAFSFLSLFTSFSTLLCCALPSLFVLFGLGATVASVLSAAPWLVRLSHHKNWVFTVAGLLIGGNFLYVYRIAPELQRRRGACCADDPDAC